MFKKKEKPVTEPTEPVETSVPVQAPISLGKLYSYATPLDKLLLLLGILFGIAAGFALPFSARFFREIIDSVTQYQQGKIDKMQLYLDVDSVGKSHAYLGVSVFIASYISSACFTFVNERQIHRIRQEYLKAVLHQNIAYFDNLGAGEITTRITTDTSLVNDGLGKLQPIVHNLVAFITGVVVSYVAQWRVALALTAVIPVSFVILGGMTGKSGALSTEALGIYSKSGTLAEEAITSIRTLIAFNRQAKISSVYDKLLNEAEVFNNKNVLVKSIGTAFFIFFIYCTYALSFFYGGELFSWGLMTSGQIVESFVAIIFGIFALFHALPYTVNIAQAKAAGAKLFEAIERVPEIDSRVTGLKPNEVQGNMSFNNIKFSYPSRPDVYIFSDFSLNIKAGTSVALVGGSGSGKSTVIQLLERFYDPEAGSVTLDGKDIKTLDVKWLRRQIGLVSQEPTLFSGTVAENVAIGLIGTSSEHDSLDSQLDQIKDACKMANAHDFISSLPKGYNTQVGERGFLLSGGQKQRIAIARAIIKNPKILLLDEATSALDSKAEVLVQEALDKASQGRTTITVAHRLSTIKNADQIVVMDRGQIIEVGNHDELMNINEGSYKKLVDLQSVVGAKYPTKSEALSEDTAPIHNLSYKDSKRKTGSSFEPLLESQLTNSNNLESGDQPGLPKLSTFTVFVRLYSMISSHYYLIAIATVGNLLLGLNHAAIAVISSTLLEVFAKSGDDLMSDVSFYATLFFVVAIAVGLGQFFSFYGYGISSEKLNTRLRSNSFKGILQQEVGWFDSDANSTGKLITALSEDPTNVQGFSGSGLSPLLNATITLLSTSIVGLVYGWKLALTIIAFLPYFLYSGYMIILLAKKSGDRNKAAYAKSADMACENATAMRTVAALTKEDFIFQQYITLLETPLKDGYKSAFTTTIMNGMSQSSFFWINGLAFWYGGRLVADGEYTLQNIFVAFLALTTGANNIGGVIANSPDMNRAYDSANYLFYLINRKPLIDSSEVSQGKKVQPNQVKGNIKFEDVKFSYPTRKSIQVLKGLSFEVKAGQFVAIVGPSGSGKSTVINLVERFYDVDSGKVTIDGTDTRDFHLPSIRDSMSLVGQEPSLYNMSIFENIAFGAKSSSSTPTQAEVEAAAKAANIHNFIVNLPQGYQTTVGGKGSQLSGGQKQRIAIARALIRNPIILLLDEATSALDAESEKVVQQALDNAKQGRTTIAIAHKLATIKNADLILVLKDGVVQEKGTHAELLEKGGIYTDMASQQSF